jgi:hypothetical protein
VKKLPSPTTVPAPISVRSLDFPLQVRTGRTASMRYTVRSSAPFHQHLAGRQGGKLQNSQNRPLRRAEPTQGRQLRAISHGIQTSQVKTRGVGRAAFMMAHGTTASPASLKNENT